MMVSLIYFKTSNLNGTVVEWKMIIGHVLTRDYGNIIISIIL